MRMSRVPRIVRVPFVAVLSLMFGVALTIRCTYFVCSDFMKNKNNNKDIWDYFSDDAHGVNRYR